eukprot:2229604-Rhodomonas_salina.1
MRLRVCYGMPGTDYVGLWYGATRSFDAVHSQTSQTVLRRYDFAMRGSGTDVGHRYLTAAQMQKIGTGSRIWLHTPYAVS